MNPTFATIDAAAARAAAVRPEVGGFPYLAEALRDAGVTKYYFDVPSCTVLYATPDGDVLQPGAFLRHQRTVIPPFDQAELIEAIRRDQRGESTFPEFVEATLLAGVIRYEVDTDNRTCSYSVPTANVTSSTTRRSNCRRYRAVASQPRQFPEAQRVSIDCSPATRVL